MPHPQNLSVVYAYPSMIDDAVAFCRANNIIVLAIQRPGSEASEPDSDRNVTVVADLDDLDELAAVSQVAADLMPNMLVFAVDSKRGDDRFRVNEAEEKIIQDLLWLHAGRAGFIKTTFVSWPSKGEVREAASYNMKEVAA